MDASKSNAGLKDFISTLPRELFAQCLKHLSSEDLFFNAQRVSRKFHYLIHELPELSARLFYVRETEAEEAERFYWIEPAVDAIYHCAQDPLRLGRPKPECKEIALRCITHPFIRTNPFGQTYFPSDEALTIDIAINPLLLRNIDTTFHSKYGPVWRVELGVLCAFKVRSLAFSQLVSRSVGESTQEYVSSCLDMYLTMPPVESMVLMPYYSGDCNPFRETGIAKHKAGLKVRHLLEAFAQFWPDRTMDFGTLQLHLEGVMVLSAKERAEIAVTGKRKYQHVNVEKVVSQEEYDRIEAKYRAQGY